MDPQLRLMLEVSYEAIVDGGKRRRRGRRRRGRTEKRKRKRRRRRGRRQGSILRLVQDDTPLFCQKKEKQFIAVGTVKMFIETRPKH
jgi:hypothetical protein